jgi:hypothetical protein
MNRPTPLSTATLPIGNSISRSPLRRDFFLIAVACFALSPAPKAFGVSPPPDGGYPGGNTAEGQTALFSLTTGSDNTANGVSALSSNTTGNDNTANGASALFSNTTGYENTATGFAALFSNTTGFDNTANGFEALAFNTIGVGNTANGDYALYNNTTGSVNTANGASALYSNTTGYKNTATGLQALFSNTTGFENTVDGYQALYNNTAGSVNTATGLQALFSNTTGYENTATGYDALFSNTTGFGNVANGEGSLNRNTTGSFNIALGYEAGFNLTTGSDNIEIGNKGVAGEANTIRIGKVGTQQAAFIAGISGTAVTGAAVVVEANGQLGVAPSSQRFKDEIKPMDKASEAILTLKPVTFRYKQEIDPKGSPQFGLVAEEVEKVNPALVARDADGKVYTVRYEAVNAMLLNEFLKEHRKVEEQERKLSDQDREQQEQEASITQLKSTAAKQEATIAERQKGFESKIAHQQEQIEALTAGLQRVNAQVEMSYPASQMALNNPVKQRATIAHRRPQNKTRQIFAGLVKTSSITSPDVSTHLRPD